MISSSTYTSGVHEASLVDIVKQIALLLPALSINFRLLALLETMPTASFVASSAFSNAGFVAKMATSFANILSLFVVKSGVAVA